MAYTGDWGPWGRTRGGGNLEAKLLWLLPVSLDLAEPVAHELLWPSGTAEAALHHLEGNDGTFPLLE